MKRVLYVVLFFIALIAVGYFIFTGCQLGSIDEVIALEG